MSAFGLLRLQNSDCRIQIDWRIESATCNLQPALPFAVGVGPLRRSVLDTREGSARGSSERERASEASGGGAPRALEEGPTVSGVGVGPHASK